MVDVSLKIPLGEFIGEIDRAMGQVPFAMALALTRTAQDVNQELKGDLGRHFEIRRKWVAGGMRITPAKKTHLRAEVGSIDEFMALHAGGGFDEPRAGTGALGVPIGARPSKEAVTPRSKWPGAMLARAGKQTERRLARAAARDTGKKRRRSRARPKPFLRTVGGRLGIYIRDGREQSPIRPLWVFKKRVRIPDDWPFDKTVMKTIDRVWDSRAVESMEKALFTRRRR
jgi:hypothetical protein